MKAIIDGLLYDTDKSIVLAEFKGGYLYRTWKLQRYFLVTNEGSTVRMSIVTEQEAIDMVVDTHGVDKALELFTIPEA